MWRRLFISILILGLPGLMLVPAWRLGGLGPAEDDVLYYYPSRWLFGQMVRGGTAPWLNPYTGCDRPFLADPQTAVFYPTTWLFAALDAPRAYGAGLWLHYSLAMWAMYRLLRANKLSWAGGLFGGIVFAFCGFMLAHRAHFSLQHAAAWTPLVLWRTQRFLERGGTGRFAMAAAAVAAQCFAGHVQIAFLTFVGLLVYVSFVSFPANQSFSSFIRLLAKRLTAVALVWLAAGGLFAVQWLPTAEYVRVCDRVQRGYWDFVENSWYPVSATGWLFPMLLGQRTPNFFATPYWGPSHQVEQFAYAGVLPLLLALGCILAGFRRGRGVRAWTALLVFSILLALGKMGPICPWLYYLPGASLFRVPARAMLLFDLSVAALAASALDRLARALSIEQVRMRDRLRRLTAGPVLLGLTLVCVAGVWLVVTLAFLSRDIRERLWEVLSPANPALWAPLFVIAASVGGLTWLARHWRSRWPILGAFVVTILDLAIIGWTLDVPVGKHTVDAMVESADRPSWLEHVRGSNRRVWVVTERAALWKPGEYVDAIGKGVANTNILDRIATLSDYGPLQPLAFTRQFDFKPWGEAGCRLQMLADPNWAANYDVGWILVCDETLPAPADWPLVATTPAGYRLYEAPEPPARAAFADPAAPGLVTYLPGAKPYEFQTVFDLWAGQESPDAASPASQRREPTLGDATIVLARCNLPGWVAELNGAALPVISPDGVRLAARVPAGATDGLIRWTYFPPGLRAGALISIVTAAGLLASCVLVGLRRAAAGKQPGEGPEATDSSV